MSKKGGERDNGGGYQAIGRRTREKKMGSTGTQIKKGSTGKNGREVGGGGESEVQMKVSLSAPSLPATGNILGLFVRGGTWRDLKCPLF